jgi:hypothetical protein
MNDMVNVKVKYKIQFWENGEYHITYCSTDIDMECICSNLGISDVYFYNLGDNTWEFLKTVDNEEYSETYKTIWNRKHRMTDEEYVKTLDDMEKAKYGR